MDIGVSHLSFMHTELYPVVYFCGKDFGSTRFPSRWMSSLVHDDSTERYQSFSDVKHSGVHRLSSSVVDQSVEDRSSATNIILTEE